MLAPAPYQVSAGEDKDEDEEAQGSFHSGGSPGNSSGEIRTPASKGGKEGRTDIPSPHGKKRVASENLETEVPKQGKKTSPGGPAPEGVLTAPCPQMGQPSTEL